MTSSPDLLHSINQLIQSAGTVFIATLAWRVSRYLTKMEGKFDGLGEKIETLGSNHLHHVEEEIRELRTALMNFVTTLAAKR